MASYSPTDCNSDSIKVTSRKTTESSSTTPPLNPSDSFSIQLDTLRLKTIQEIEEFIEQDRSCDDPHQSNQVLTRQFHAPFHDDFRKVATELLDSNIQCIGILALMPGNLSHFPPLEIDGIHGLILLCRLFLRLYKKCIILTDSINQQILCEMFQHMSIPSVCKPYEVQNQSEDDISKVQIYGFPPVLAWDTEANQILKMVYDKCDYLLSLKRPGSGIQGHYWHPCGLTMDHYIAPLDIAFKWANQSKKRTATLASIGNELGMGSFWSSIDMEKVSKKTISSETDTWTSGEGIDYTDRNYSNRILVSHTCSWASMGLAAVVALSVNYKYIKSPAEIDQIWNLCIINDLDESLLQAFFLEKEIWDSISHSSTTINAISWVEHDKFRNKLKSILSKYFVYLLYSDPKSSTFNSSIDC